REEKLKEFVRNGGQMGFHATFIHQQSPLGTADALRSCKTWLKGESKFIVAYGDDYYSTKSIASITHPGKRSRGEVIAAARSEEPARFGRLEIERGRVKAIREKTPGDGPAWINAGLYILTESFFQTMDELEKSPRGEYELTDFINHVIHDGDNPIAL